MFMHLLSCKSFRSMGIHDANSPSCEFFNKHMYIYAVLRYLVEYIYKVEDRTLGGSICLVKIYR